MYNLIVEILNVSTISYHEFLFCDMLLLKLYQLHLILYYELSHYNYKTKKPYQDDMVYVNYNYNSCNIILMF